MKASLTKESARRRGKRTSESERELSFARAIIQSPDQHEEATLRAACKLLSTVGIAEDRRNAMTALAQLALKAETPEQLPAQPPLAEHFARVEGLPAWVKGGVVSALLLAIVITPLLLN